MSSAKTSLRPDLPAQTALRGLAALNVFFAHAHFNYLFPRYPTLSRVNDIFSWSANGVDLFFELSGFILCYVYLHRPAQWKAYFMARFARIYPAYLATLLFFLSLNVLAYLRTGIFSSETNWTMVFTNLFLVQRWVLPPVYSLNEPTWSISIEVMLYIFMFPALCYLQKFTRFSAKAVLAVLPVALLCFLYTQGFNTPGHDFMAPVRGVLCFVSGFFICCAGLDLKFRGLEGKGQGLFFLLVAVSLLVQVPLNRNLVDLCFPFLLYFSASPLSFTTRMLNFPVLVWLGDLSYSIYLWHWPLIKALGVLVGVRQLGQNDMRPNSVLQGLLYMVLLIGVTLAVSHISHYYFEMPIVRWFRKVERRERAAAPAGPSLDQPH